MDILGKEIQSENILTDAYLLDLSNEENGYLLHPNKHKRRTNFEKVDFEPINENTNLSSLITEANYEKKFIDIAKKVLNKERLFF